MGMWQPYKYHLRGSFRVMRDMKTWRDGVTWRHSKQQVNILLDICCNLHCISPSLSRFSYTTNTLPNLACLFSYFASLLVCVIGFHNTLRSQLPKVVLIDRCEHLQSVDCWNQPFCLSSAVY
ncbi:hypothetical protein MANES_06G034207v8 [Manihot esculenta]|uniref:Uncharacterized protein n=1 Tax=Manihot esculenta TaxID=3983 RepID=A0ACB7HJP4_MANES|nr:hypothetical protein MANES_06G034207v8 [Manihot esculenta]